MQKSKERWTKTFKAYDIRGKVPEQLDEELAYRIGRAYVELFNAGKVAVGHDIRISSPFLAAALVKGLTEAGCDVIDVGLCGTEQVYFTTFHLELDGGVMVTASHNPKEYNGMKLVLSGARPVSGDSGLRELERRVASGDFEPGVSLRGSAGSCRGVYIMDAYVRHLFSYIDTSTLAHLKVVVNAGNGCAGPVIDAMEPFLPFHFVKINHEPDSGFPNGVPNPLLPENRDSTAKAVRESGADIGIAWDGDFDRCFFFDEQGNFIEGYYIVGILARFFLERCPGAKVIHDPRLTWNTIDMVRQAGGIPVQCRTGHAFIKERMRLEGAVYGGEMSAHHYFRDFRCCDSGMIPWLLILEIMSREGKPLSQLVGERIRKYPVSGEINWRVVKPEQVIKKIEECFAEGAIIDRTDGLSMEFADWRFNLRMSNTEPVLRLNVETKGDQGLLRKKTMELNRLVESFNNKLQSKNC